MSEPHEIVKSLWGKRLADFLTEDEVKTALKAVEVWSHGLIEERGSRKDN